MSILAGVSKFALAIYVISSLLPLSKSDAWWIRVLDFPRLQMLGFGLFFFLLFNFISKDENLVKLAYLSLVIIALGFDLFRILPYTVLWPVESRAASESDPSRKISLLTANVFQDNKKSNHVIDLILDKKPDLVLLLEVNKRWIKDLAPIKSQYHYHLEEPMENEYGLVFYSNLPVKKGEIKYLIEEKIPSLHASIALPSGDVVEVFGLHPRPPGHQSDTTTQRDAELVQVAKTVRASKVPSIVLGDLNDVAWSHTTRLFRRISTLLDPRVGRGPYPTFPTYFYFLRFPLDYVFHSEKFTLNSIERLNDIGSDHLPIFVSLTLKTTLPKKSSGLEIKEGDLEEAHETIQRAKNKD